MAALMAGSVAVLPPRLRLPRPRIGSHPLAACAAPDSDRGG